MLPSTVARLVAALTACALSAGALAADPTVRRGSFRKTVVLTGSLQAATAERHVVPVTDVWRMQLKWLAEEGTLVQPGDAVARLDTASVLSELTQAELALDDKLMTKLLDQAAGRQAELDLQVELRRAETELRKAEIDRVPAEIAGVQAHEQSQLAHDRALKAFEEAETALDAHRTKLASDLVALDIESGELEARVSRFREEIDSLELKAGTTGLVIHERNWRGTKPQVGDTVRGTQRLVQIPDLETLQVVAWLSESDASLVREGAAATVTLDALPGRTYGGAVSAISKTAVERHRWSEAPYFEVTIQLEQRDPELMKPGMSAQCELVVEQHDDVLLVPIEAVRFERDEYWVEPLDGEPLAMVPLAFNEVDAAVSPGASGGIAVGQALSTPAWSRLDDSGVSTGEATATGEAPTSRRVKATGELESASAVHVGCPAIERMWRFNVTFMADEGKEAEKGDKVIGFDDQELAEKLQLRSAELDTASKQLEKSALDEHERLDGLVLERAERAVLEGQARRKIEVPSDLHSRLELEKLKLDWELARDELEMADSRVTTQRVNMKARRRSAENRVSRLQAAVTTLEESVEKLTVKAPRNGFVVHAADWGGDKVEVGESVWYGQTVVDLADLSQMRVKAEVDEVDAGQVAIGQIVDIRLDANPNRLFSGRVESLGRIFRTKAWDNPSMVFDALISIDEPDPELMRPGMAAKLEIVVEPEDTEQQR